MTQPSDWSAARGEKWLAHHGGMESMLSPVDDPLIRALSLDAPCRIADLGCGGGAITAEILHRAPRGTVVQGFDISPALVALARSRHSATDPSIAFHLADLGTAPPPAPFDRLVSRFGLMFFADPPAAFANLARWLAPGGRFAFAVWGPPAENPWFTTVRDAAAESVALPAPQPDAPGPFRYADATTLLALLEQAGFGEVHATSWRGTLPVGGPLPPAEAANFALAALSTFGELLAAAGPEALSAARRSLTERFARHHHAGAVRLDACVHLVTGTRAARV